MAASDIVVCHRRRLLHCESSFPWSWPPFFFFPMMHFTFTGKTSIDCFEDIFDSVAEIIVGKTKTKRGRRWRSWIHIIMFCYIKYSNMWWQPTQKEKSESLQFCVGERVAMWEGLLLTEPHPHPPQELPQHQSSGDQDVHQACCQTPQLQWAEAHHRWLCWLHGTETSPLVTKYQSACAQMPFVPMYVVNFFCFFFLTWMM